MDNTEIYNAAVFGDYELVDKLINANPALVNAKDKYGCTPLHGAGSARLDMKPQMSIFGGLLLIAMVVTNAHPIALNEPRSTVFETRCGWLTNPTPANVWLYDREGEWTIGVQGGYQVEGDWPWPAFKRGQWVRTNAGSYGYGCVCLQLRVNKQTHEVLEIKTSRVRPLAQCRQDPSLKKWKRLLK